VSILLESKTLEYKREFSDTLKKTVIAFANTDGGQILIGIEDNGKVLGVSDVDGTLLRATNAIRDSIRPDVTLFTEVRSEIIDGKNIVVIDVQRGTARPYYFSTKGLRPEGVFVRQGASTVPATETAILHMIKETSGDRYENSRSLNQNLTFKSAEDYFVRKHIPFANPQKKTLGLIGDDDTFTNLALLLSDQCPHTIKIAVFQGNTKTLFKDRREFSGSLFKQLEEAFEFIDRYNSVQSQFVGLERMDKRDYPVEALREAFLNTLVHRDYGLSSSILISIFDDRIEFVTIGGLIKGLNLNDIMLGVSALRNPNLANIFYRLKLIEAYGTGIQKIMEAYRGTPVLPTIETSDNAFKTTLPNSNAGQSQSVGSLSSRQQQVLQLFRHHDSITRKQVEEALQVSQATAILLLREMVDKKILIKNGNGKNLSYRCQTSID